MTVEVVAEEETQAVEVFVSWAPKRGQGCWTKCGTKKVMSGRSQTQNGGQKLFFQGRKRIPFWSQGISKKGIPGLFIQVEVTFRRQPKLHILMIKSSLWRLTNLGICKLF